MFCLCFPSILSLFLCMVLGSSLISFFFPCSCQLFPAALIEETLFAPLYILPSFQTLAIHRCVGLFLSFLSCSIGLYFHFSFSTIRLDDYSFVVSSKSGRLIPLALFFFLKIALAIQVFYVSL